MSTHEIDIRIYYEDTDAGGVVYHAQYLNFAERARCELMRDIRHECSKLEEEFGFIFVVKHIDVEYIKPCFLDDALKVVTTVEHMKNTSFKTLHRVQKNSVTICEMHTTLVCVDTNTIKPVAIPPILRTEFEKLIEG